MKEVFTLVSWRFLILAYVLLFGTGGVATATGLFSNVPEASSFNLVYEFDIPVNSPGWNSTPVAYTVDNSAGIIPGSFTRIAYYLELVSLTGATTNWVYVSMDAFTTNAAKIGVPNVASGEFYNHFNTPVSNANIYSNNGGITPATGTNTVNLEFWPSNYGQGNDYGVPGADGGAFDFGDGSASTGDGHACMQIHNYGAGQTLFSYNAWGGARTSELGIGPPGSGNADWTFNTGNISTFSLRTLQILVRGLPSISNSGGATGITATTAYISGVLASTGSAPTSVWAFWGMNDANTNKASWGKTNFFGVNAAIPPVSFTTNLAGLTSDTNYYYRFYASNQQGSAWAASTVAFKTLPNTPSVSNSGGATGVTSVSAFLNGTVTSTGAAPTYVSIFSGTTDGGTNITAWGQTNYFGQRLQGAFTTNSGGLSPDLTYYYRCYGSNSFAGSWAPTSSVFITGQVTIQATDSNAAETGLDPGRFTVFRPATTTNAPLTVSYSVAGTTSNGLDYQVLSNYVTIAADSTNADVNITPIDDAVIENMETVLLKLLPGPYIVGGLSNATVSITNNDFKGTFRMKMKVTFSGHMPQGGAPILTNFPALVILNESYARFSYSDFYSPSNGGDLRFMNSNETVYLNYEIEEWNTNGNSLVWVQVPELVGTNTFIWVYWRSSIETNALPCTTNGSTWDSNFVGVWHMKEINSVDSTRNRFSGTSRFNVSDTGLVDGAQSFATLDSAVELPAAIAAQFVSNVTLEAFSFVNGYAGTDPCIFTEKHNNTGLLFDMGVHSSSNLFVGLWTNTWYEARDPSPMPTSQWVYVSGTYDGSYVRLYRDGTLVRTSGYVGRKLPSSGIGFRIGHRWDGTENWPGTIDEVRLSNVTRSPTWLWASWMNQISNSVFNAYGPGMDGVPRGTAITVR